MSKCFHSLNASPAPAVHSVMRVSGNWELSASLSTLASAYLELMLSSFCAQMALKRHASCTFFNQELRIKAADLPEYAPGSPRGSGNASDLHQPGSCDAVVAHGGRNVPYWDLVFGKVLLRLQKLKPAEHVRTATFSLPYCARQGPGNLAACTCSSLQSVVAVSPAVAPAERLSF